MSGQVPLSVSATRGCFRGFLREPRYRCSERTCHLSPDRVPGTLSAPNTKPCQEGGQRGHLGDRSHPNKL